MTRQSGAVMLANEGTFIHPQYGAILARPIEKRDQIEHAVLDVVARKGLHATTVQDIANAADVSPGLLYRYWRNRDDLAGAVYEEHYVRLVDRLARVTDSQSDVVLKLHAMIKAFLEFADERPVLLRFLLLSQHDLAVRVPEERGVRALLRRIIADGQARGRIRSMPLDVAVQLLLGMALQPAVGMMYGHLKPPVSAQFDAIIGAITRALLTEPATG